jgi:hypothetical protein
VLLAREKGKRLSACRRSIRPKGARVRVGLVSCSKAKLDHAAPARELYSKSALFRGARCHVERTCDRWFVLSAKHGLVKPEQVLEPYNQTLNDASPAERRAWSATVLAQLQAELGDLRGTTFEAHAGAAYLYFGLADGLIRLGAGVENPLDGLGLGKRLQFYGEKGCL